MIHIIHHQKLSHQHNMFKDKLKHIFFFGSLYDVWEERSRPIAYFKMLVMRRAYNKHDESYCGFKWIELSIVGLKLKFYKEVTNRFHIYTSTVIIVKWSTTVPVSSITMSQLPNFAQQMEGKVTVRITSVFKSSLFFVLRFKLSAYLEWLLQVLVWPAVLALPFSSYLMFST